MDELAKLICEYHGKTFEDVKGFHCRGLEVLNLLGISSLLKPIFFKNVGTNIDSWSIRQPLGVTAGITPFNFFVNGSNVDLLAYSIACGAFILKGHTHI